MTLLGAIIAGGRSCRFGGDKAAAVLGGRSLIAHVHHALAQQTDEIVVCGRAWPDLTHVDDRPTPGLGPLGGLAGALNYCRVHGFAGVLTAGCDVLPVPCMKPLIGSLPAVIAGQPLFGYWPRSLCEQLEAHLASQSDHSLRHWVAISGARTVRPGQTLYNLNTRLELAQYEEIIRGGGP